MAYTAAEQSGLDQVARDGGATVLAARLGLLMILLAVSFIVALMLVTVRDTLVRTSSSFPDVRVEAGGVGR